MLDNIESHGLYVRMFRADCGSFIKELVEELFLRTETFYLRASSCADRRQMYEPVHGMAAHGGKRPGDGRHVI